MRSVYEQASETHSLPQQTRLRLAQNELSSAVRRPFIGSVSDLAI